jgi:hypothetical protein
MQDGRKQRHFMVVGQEEREQQLIFKILLYLVDSNNP